MPSTLAISTSAQAVPTRTAFQLFTTPLPALIPVAVPLDAGEPHDKPQ
jgi:hypothetical protein